MYLELVLKLVRGAFWTENDAEDFEQNYEACIIFLLSSMPFSKWLPKLLKRREKPNKI